MRPSLRALPVIVCMSFAAVTASGQAVTPSLRNSNASAPHAAYVAPSHPDSIPAAARTQISAAVGHDQIAYRALPQPDGFRMASPGTGLSGEFVSSGISLRTRSSRWGMTLVAYGYRLRPASASLPRANANRVEYDRDGLTEWYENGPFGLEQGFTFLRAPGESHGKPLTLALALSGGLDASIDPDRRGLTLRKNGSASLRYAGLSATDARGRQLNTWMEVTGNRLRLRVDDSGAQYPVTIDPTFQLAWLVSGSGLVVDDFGCSVAISSDGNTIVVGAMTATVGSNFNQGAAYVFTKAPTAAWNTVSSFAAKLTASNGASDTFFGTAVAISGDGGTIAVLVPLADSNFDGAVYLFVKPSTGWASMSPLNEVNFILGPPAFGGFAPFNGILGATPTPVPTSPVALSNDGSTLAVGAPGIGANPPQGEVEVFVTANGWVSFNSSQLTASDGGPGDLLGEWASISGDGNTVVATSYFGGPVWVFTKPTGGWGTSTQTAELSVTESGATSVGITGNGDTIVVSALGVTPPGFLERAAFVFVRPTGGWVTTSSPDATLTPSNYLDALGFGTYVSISGDGSTILVGIVINDADYDGGYLFARPAGGWATSTETTQLTCFQTASITTSRSNVIYRPPLITIAAGSILTAGTGPCQIQNNGPEQDLTYVFTGYAQSPFPSLSLEQLNLTAYTGTTSNSQPVTVTNSGTAPLGISSVAATGPFTTTQNCVAASPIPPGGTCTEYVIFDATGAGAFTGTLTFTDDAGEVEGSTQQVTLNGTGEDFSLSVSPSSQTIPPGHLAAYTLTVSPLYGFTGTVYLSCGSEPPHTRCTISPASVNVPNSTSTATATIDQENKGTYTLSFTGADSALQHTATVTLGVK